MATTFPFEVPDPSSYCAEHTMPYAPWPNSLVILNLLSIMKSWLKTLLIVLPFCIMYSWTVLFNHAFDLEGVSTSKLDRQGRNYRMQTKILLFHKLNFKQLPRVVFAFLSERKIGWRSELSELEHAKLILGKVGHDQNLTEKRKKNRARLPDVAMHRRFGAQLKLEYCVALKSFSRCPCVANLLTCLAFGFRFSSNQALKLDDNDKTVYR